MIDSEPSSWDGEGPFSPERSGTLPAGDLIRAAFSGEFSMEEMLSMITGKGGIKAYLGTADVKKLLEEENQYDRKIIDAMVYQIAKHIGQSATVLKGKIDAVLFTGGLAHSRYIISQLLEYIDFLPGETKIYPGENELEALAYNGFLVWQGKILPKEYKPGL